MLNYMRLCAPDVLVALPFTPDMHGLLFNLWNMTLRLGLTSFSRLPSQLSGEKGRHIPETAEEQVH